MAHRMLVSNRIVLYRVRTGPGRPGKSWKKAPGPGKFWKSVKLSQKNMKCMEDSKEKSPGNLFLKNCTNPVALY